MPIPSFLEIIIIIFAYLLGSIASSIIVCRAFNLPDPRTVGSNNAGATNVLRIGGKKVAAITLVFDILKGLLPVIIAQLLQFDFVMVVIIGFAALLGHIFPVFFNFRGGKGVATFIGVLLAANIYSGLIFVAIWLFVAKVLKISSLSALVATASIVPIFYFLTTHESATYIIMAMSILIFITHRGNISRLINKEEDKVNV